MKRRLVSLVLGTLAVGCQHESYGVRPEPPNAPQGPAGRGLPVVGAFADRAEEIDPNLRRFAEVHLTTQGAYAGQGEGTLFHDGATWVDLMLFSTLPGTYTLRFVPNCLGMVDATRWCEAGGPGYLGTVTVDPQGNATGRFAVPGVPDVTGQGLALYGVVTDATSMPGQPSCVATACGTVEPAPPEPPSQPIPPPPPPSLQQKSS